MDTETFYGKKRVVVNSIFNGDDSFDENLSDENEFRKRPEFFDALVEESDNIDEKDECEGEDVIIPETDSEKSEWDSEDEIPLAQLAKQENKKKKEKKQKTKLTWQEKYLTVDKDEIAFKGSESLPTEISELDTPFQFFRYIFTQELVSHITEETNIYSVQERPEKPCNVSEEEINVFIGICIYMSVIHLPSTRSYWNSSLEIPAISHVMTCNRFEEIKRFLHFNNNQHQIQRGEPGYDKLFKIRPFINKIRERLLKVPKEEYLAVDEQIIPTKARSSLKQYNPKKPHKWGYKVFVLSGVSGFSYDFDIYVGANEVSTSATNLGTSSNVVVKLAETIHRNQNYKLFFDNWFTSLPLLVYLTKEGILPLGTVRTNRLPNCELPKESVMKKMGRGAFVEKVTQIDGVDINLVCWYDNKVVTTVSTYVGSQPVSEVRRFSKKDNTYISISRPQCIEVYNNYMGGVDLLDSMLGYYRIMIRSKKWYLRIFFHFIDMICVDAWLLWRRTKTQEYLPLSEFKLGIAEVLTRSNSTNTNKKRGRPSNILQSQLDLKKKKYPFAQIPAQEIRQDNQNHLPKWTDRQRCKYPECSLKTHTFCEKCQVHLCINKDRNCFYSFHTD